MNFVVQWPSAINIACNKQCCIECNVMCNAAGENGANEAAAAQAPLAGDVDV